ncbi:MAG TPA: hypothetical protein VGR84_00805 [Candidatus Acidoferrales bacterium]|nr:hypothetical protein [Candidatus Acidoferrales bacterium]
MSLAKAKRGNQAVDGLADGVSPLTEAPEISRGLDRQVLTASLKYFELPKFTQHSGERLLVPDTLKGLAQNQIRQSEALPTKLAIKVLGLSVSQAAQIVDPHRGINNHHWLLLRKSPATRLVQIPFPADLASKPANGGLRPCLNQQAQSFLDRGPFCP